MTFVRSVFGMGCWVRAQVEARHKGVALRIEDRAQSFITTTQATSINCF
jgi:hypothetical protein